MSKRRLSSGNTAYFPSLTLTALLAVHNFFFSGTQETIISENEQEQCPENYLTRFHLTLC